MTEIISRIEPGFEAYEDAWSDVNAIHPQHQGLRSEEFAAMLRDPTTVKTDVMIGDEVVEIPQLTRVTNFDWLDEVFFTNHFPTETQNNTLVYLVQSPGVEIGPTAQEKLHGLAQQSGVLAFDIPIIPETDHLEGDVSSKKLNDLGVTKERILQELTALGVEYEEPELLGTQTYFAGQSRLKRSHEALAAPLGFLEAYDKGVAAGRYNPDAADGVVVRRTVDPQTAQYMYDFYAAAYERLKHPCKQGLDPEEFLDMVVNNPQVAKLISLKDGVPQSLYLACDNLDLLTWVNPVVYSNKYPKQYEQKQLIWYPGIATDPRPEVAHGNSIAMVKLMAELAEAGDNEFVALMDFCDENAGWLPGYLADEINKTTEGAINIEPFASQEYWAVRLKPRA